MDLFGGTGGDFILVAVVTAINLDVAEYKTKILTQGRTISRIGRWTSLPFVLTMKIFKNLRIWHNPFSFYQEKPMAIRVYPCPACKETISAEANNCRFCHLPIDAATAERLLVENQRVTNAVASANTFRLSVSLAALVILWGIMEVLTKGPSPAVFLPLVGIGYGALWLYRYQSLTTSDVDYPRAVKRVKRITLIWLLALVLPWGIVKLNVAEPELVTQKTGVELQGTNPPVFVLSGPGSVTNFSVGIFSPALPEESPNRVQIIWEIVPNDIFSTKVQSVGQIAYGKMPQRFTQYIPVNGPPLPLSSLEPGKYYVFYLLTMNAPHVMGAFEMKDGKASRVYGLPFCVELNEKWKGVWTRCRGDENPAK